jgi:hypothetical protein
VPGSDLSEDNKRAKRQLQSGPRSDYFYYLQRRYARALTHARTRSSRIPLMGMTNNSFKQRGASIDYANR